ncbi:Sporulation and spore germination [uncultured Dorea sp.]|uniref:GerMN domain-containing protein n=1 Tax=Dorea formicigenerans TaxID=39486 RepID=UPI000820370B|nr:GerMN domain-containing protein [uncultured Dorea sp.]SCH26498.1 Sporulation and spore germination [uncultured Dorea sp.]
MKKRIVVLLLTGVLLSVSACSNSAGINASKSDGQKMEQQEEESKVDREDNKEHQDQADQEESDKKFEDTVSNEDKSVEIQLYVSNDDATAFVSESVKIDELTPENIVKVLIEKSVLPSDVQVLKCDKQTVDGVESLDVDFNEAFGTYVCSMGTTGEYYTIGSVVNTFLDAYGCEKIKITVEENTLETGHAEYPGYMNRFE